VRVLELEPTPYGSANCSRGFLIGHGPSPIATGWLLVANCFLLLACCLLLVALGGLPIADCYWLAANS
jgi:hypothetical protein